MNWRAEAFAKMKINKITNLKLAEHLEVTPEFVSEVLNGREIKSGKCSPQNIMAAIEEIIAIKS